MNGSTAPCPATHAAARLLIHAAADLGQARGRLAAALRRWRHWTGHAAHGEPSAQLFLQVADLQGHALFTAREWQGLIDVPLPAGTYHVIVNDGSRQRRYTVALDQGSTFDLHLLPACPGHR